jgi:hypothetical protein
MRKYGIRSEGSCSAGRRTIAPASNYFKCHRARELDCYFFDLVGYQLKLVSGLYAVYYPHHNLDRISQKSQSGSYSQCFYEPVSVFRTYLVQNLL